MKGAAILSHALTPVPDRVFTGMEFDHFALIITFFKHLPLNHMLAYFCTHMQI